MRWIAKYRKQRMGALAAAIAVTAWMPTAMALPSGDDNRNNVSVEKKSDTLMEVTISGAKGAVDWKKFNIEKGETVNFHGATPGWKVLNRVTGGHSTINGTLQSFVGEKTGGTVFIVNPQGITFGGSASVDVGSLVASTLDITQSDFMNNNFAVAQGNNNGKAITVKDGASVKATDGVVALLANKVTVGKNSSITAGEVDVAAGNKIQVSYDDKISVEVQGASDHDKIDMVNINNGKDYVLMTSKAAVNLLSDTVNSNRTIKADKITIDKDGNVELTGDKVLIDGKINAEGSVTTTGKNVLQVNDSADIHAKTWNINAKNVDVVEGVKTPESLDNLENDVSSKVISAALKDTNVNITASPNDPTYYADINIKNKIKKTEGGNTELTFTAGRNISVDADITSTEGALKVTLNSNNQKLTKSKREDGATVIKANIATNGGDFTTTGSVGTYFGLKNYGAQDGESIGTERSVVTNGGNIRLEGEQVLLATGGDVVLEAGTGEVYIEGKVDSANVYRNVNSQDDENNGNISWKHANDKFANSSASHLAVITSRLEDSVVSASIPKKSNISTEAYVGGHVVAVPDGAEFAVEEYTVKDANGNDVTKKRLVITKGLTDDGEISEDKLKLVYSDSKLGYQMRNKSRGWYKIDDNTLVRLWAWTSGPEKGKVFYVEAVRVTDADGKSVQLPDSMLDKDINTFKSYTQTRLDNAIGYVNFAPGEPNDDFLKTNTENALAVNYDTYIDSARKDRKYSQWDDIFETTGATAVNNHMQNYVVETEIGHTALKITSAETTLNDAVGSITKLNNLNIDSSANIKALGSVQVDNSVVAKVNGNAAFASSIDAEKGQVYISAGNDASVKGKVNAGDSVAMLAGHDVMAEDAINTKNDVYMQAYNDITTAAVTAENTVNMKADNNVTINGAITGKAEENPNAVVIRAQERFLNYSGAGQDSVKAGNRSNWKIYSNNPQADDFGGLYSDNFACWNRSAYMTEVNTEGKNLYIFKYQPKLTIMANSKDKKYGETLTDVGYVLDYNLKGLYTDAFKDGNDTLLKGEYSLNLVGTDSKGYPAKAPVGQYDIDLTNTTDGENALRAVGYDVELKQGVLNVYNESVIDEPVTDEPKNPGDVKPQLDPHNPTNLDGSASYTMAPRQAGPGADRVLGLQSAELPFFREENGQTKLYGTYDVSIDPDKVKMEPTAKVLPEPDQPKNQYREYDKELTTQAGTAKFKMTYNGTTFDIYPVDNSAKDLLVAGDAAKNVDVESQALFAAFKEMGITLDDLDGVYTHFDSKK